MDLTTRAEYEAILGVMRPHVGRYLEPHIHLVDDISLDVGQELGALVDGLSVTYPVVIEPQDIEHLIVRVGSPRDDGRIGFSGMLHRISLATNAGKEYTTAALRVGRYLIGVAECMRPAIERANGICIVGGPFKGKTATLRDVWRIRVERRGKFITAADTSDELFGTGVKPHACIGAGRRVSVGETGRQRAMIAYVLQNNSPRELLTDEIGPRDDVPLVVEYANKGVMFDATLHALNAGQAFNNLTYRPLWGLGPNKEIIGTPIFSLIIEVIDKGVYRVIEDVPAAIQSWLSGEEVQGQMVRAA
ncbi:AAA family ATPase [Deinococcus xinjiangensis]